MQTTFILITITSFYGQSVEGQQTPDHFERQPAESSLCFMHTVNNIIDEDQQWTFKLLEKLDKHLKITEPDNKHLYFEYEDDLDTIHTSQIVNDNICPILEKLLNIAGYAFVGENRNVRTNVGTGGFFQHIKISPLSSLVGHVSTKQRWTTQTGVNEVIGWRYGPTEVTIQNILDMINDNNFKAFIIHLSCEPMVQQWTHFTTIIKTLNGYFYLDPAFPLVDFTATATNIWECPQNHPVTWYPRVRVSAQDVKMYDKDCERFGIYNSWVSGIPHHTHSVFRHLASRYLGSNAQDAVDKLYSMLKGAMYVGTDLNMRNDGGWQAIWVAPVYELGRSSYLQLMQSVYGRYNKDGKNYQVNNKKKTFELPNPSSFFDNQRDLWFSPNILKALRREYSQRRSGGTGFWKAKDTLDNTNDKMSKKTCRIKNNNDPITWNKKTTKRALLVEWNRKSGYCDSKWKQSAPIIDFNTYLYNLNGDDNYWYMVGVGMVSIILCCCGIFAFCVGLCSGLFGAYFTRDLPIISKTEKKKVQYV